MPTTGDDVPAPEAPRPDHGASADLAAGYHDLVRGEGAAAVMETSLSKFESTLDALLDVVAANSQAAGDTPPEAEPLYQHPSTEGGEKDEKQPRADQDAGLKRF